MTQPPADHPAVSQSDSRDAEGRGWSDYLQDFHHAQPGITERVLRHARHDGEDPYDWVIERLPSEGRLVDLAGGNGALTVRLPPAVAATLLDSSAAEVAGARERGVECLARADTAALPLADASVDAVACSMALMLVPLWSTLTEVRRVLSRGGLLVATLPAVGPLTAGDAWRYGRLLFALRRTRLSYPNDRYLTAPGNIFAAAGLELIGDERRRFVCHIETPDLGLTLLDSLYLPDTPAHRLAAARRVAQRWAGCDLGIPLRRLIAVAR